MYNAPEKRVELHLHTNLSALDAIPKPEDVIKMASMWGKKDVAITDHGNAQAYPTAMLAAAKAGDDFKVLYSIEAYFVDDTSRALYGKRTSALMKSCGFDIETTGLSVANCRL